MSTYSEEHIKYLKKQKTEKRIIFFFRLLIIICFLVAWELLSRLELINTFLSSSPTEVIETTYQLFQDKTLFTHIPLIIIWVGASTNSIIFMALLISTFVTIITIYQGFAQTNQSYITLLKSFGANKRQIFIKAIFPSNIPTLISALKINISMSLIGVIMGELLVSKSGLGYLIMYGSQVFNINLVITGVVILGIISYIMYFIIDRLENYIKKRRGSS